MVSAGIDMSVITQEERDAAKRMADQVNLHVHADRANREHRTVAPWVAIDLADGSSDGALYDSRDDATRHQKSDFRFYVKIGLKEMPEREALVVLLYARRAYKAGHVFTHEQPLVPDRLEIAAPFVPRALRGINFRG